ncbi:MAG: hypothetical protein SGI74_06990 [Oligoflexia bacterium]|nr:hypothetical protein [Oligoflexia bacterium]
MASTQWLPLLSYSAKYGISLSTLRRRIKSSTINFKQENGKYLIADEIDDVRVTQPQQQSKPTSQSTQNFHQETQSASLQTSTFVEASVLTSANRLVEELKAAYAKILQEKEEQISLLKEEVVDLRMLVRILEDQVNRTRGAEAPRTQLPSPDDIFFGG